jgi:MoxR-like ATPase
MSESTLQKQIEFRDLVRKQYGKDRDFVTRPEVLFLKKKFKISSPSWLKQPEWRAGRGRYKIDLVTLTPEYPEISPDDLDDDEEVEEKPVAAAKLALVESIPMVTNREAFIPMPNPAFVPFGVYEAITDIVNSGEFFPAYIAGPTRCGKTELVNQACAEAKKPLIRVNITSETSESDLIGGFRLVDGSTVWEHGPVIIAMEMGATLLLDEYDLGGSKMLILQPVMEGKGIYIKKINQYVKPAKGFNVFATGNTKGRGSEDGRYMGTQIQNDAALERFAVTLDANYPDKAVEARILTNEFARRDMNPDEFIDALTTWSANVREAHKAGGTSEVITMDRLIWASRSYVIFGRNRVKAVKLAVARFDENTQVMLLDAYMKIDPKAVDGPDTRADLPHRATKSGKIAKPW